LIFLHLSTSMNHYAFNSEIKVAFSYVKERGRRCMFFKNPLHLSWNWTQDMIRGREKEKKNNPLRSLSSFGLTPKSHVSCTEILNLSFKHISFHTSKDFNFFLQFSTCLLAFSPIFLIPHVCEYTYSALHSTLITHISFMESKINLILSKKKKTK